MYRSRMGDRIETETGGMIGGRFRTGRRRRSEVSRAVRRMAAAGDPENACRAGLRDMTLQELRWTEGETGAPLSARPRLEGFRREGGRLPAAPGPEGRKAFAEMKGKAVMPDAMPEAMEEHMRHYMRLMLEDSEEIPFLRRPESAGPEPAEEEEDEDDEDEDDEDEDDEDEDDEDDEDEDWDNEDDEDEDEDWDDEDDEDEDEDWDDEDEDDKDEDDKDVDDKDD
jgi:hypothetical protein